MLVSLPLAILLTLVIAAALLRSVRFAVASVIPILFVVVGLYAFMAIAGFTINLVTATIAAIAVGVGIDFSTHFTARFREELEHEPTRLDALRKAGEGRHKKPGRGRVFMSVFMPCAACSHENPMITNKKPVFVDYFIKGLF